MSDIKLFCCEIRHILVNRNALYNLSLNLLVDCRDIHVVKTGRLAKISH